ncbi:MAG: hypothetical protein L0Z50_10030 [Verrucomicrobiales bacterium]|nr:hypothetical protein [Verrucomicrobiales bacterium]
MAKARGLAAGKHGQKDFLRNFDVIRATNPYWESDDTALQKTVSQKNKSKTTSKK